MDPRSQQPHEDPLRQMPPQDQSQLAQQYNPQPQAYQAPSLPQDRPDQNIPQQPTSQPYQNSAPPQPDNSIEYLNQIAPPTNSSRRPSKLLIIVFGLLSLLVATGILMIFLSGGRTSIPVKASQLSARLETLAGLSKDHHKNLRDNEIRATNTAYMLFLNNALSDLQAPLTEAGIEKKTTKTIAATESTYANELGAKFEDARLNVTLDRVYALEMKHQIEVVQSTMRSIYDATSSQSLRGYLDKAYSNLTPIAKEFSEFSATK